MNITNLGLIKLRKKKRTSNIVWTNDKDNIIQYANCYQNGEINLTSGKLIKNSYPSNLANKIISLTLIVPDNSEATVVSVLSSCEIAFYNIKSKCLKTVKGPHELLAHISQYSLSRSYQPLRRLQILAKQRGFSKAFKGGSDIDDETTDKENTSSYMFKPKIFSSRDLSNIILLTDYSKIYLLNEESTTHTWNTFVASSDIQMPSKNSKEACIDVSFITNGPTGLSCYVGYCFAYDNHLLLTSLTLQWYPDRIKSTPSAEWLSKTIDFNKIDDSPILVRKRKSIVMKYSSAEPILCIAVNTLRNHYYLVFYHMDCQSAATVVHCQYPRSDQRLNNRFQWVSCLEWSTCGNFVIGCLRSGYIFIATRFGPLMTISWNNSQAIPNSLYINLFPDFNHFHESLVDNDKSEQSSHSSNIFTPKFSIITSPSRKSFAVSSGLEFYWLALPYDVCSNEGVISFLLKKTHEANHRLETVLVNHDYDFIHCSNWRLAAKCHHKTSTEKNQNEEGRKCSLWFPGNAPFSNSSIHSRVLTELEIKETEVFGLLQVTWSLLASRNLKKRVRKILLKASVSETLKLFTLIMNTSSGNDNEEHQASLLQCLRFFHCLVEYSAAVTTYNFKALKLYFQVLYDMLHLIMKSVDEASSERKLICVIILTQTLILCKASLMNGNNSLFLEANNGRDSKFKKLIDILMRRHWMFLYSNLFIWKRKKLRNVPQLSCMLTVALNIIQEQSLPVIAAYRKTKITIEYRLFSSGKFLAAVENVKNEIEQLLETNFCRKRLKKCIFFPFYVLIIESQWKEFVKYIYWLYKKISSPVNKKRKLCSKKVIKYMKNIFIKLCGTLGIIMSKFILGFPVRILNNLEHYDYSSLLDNPKDNCKILNSEKHFEKNLFTSFNATRCLVIGGKYEALFQFSSKREDFNLCIFSLFALEQTPRTDFQILEEFLVNEISSHLKNNAENCSIDETSQSKLYTWTEKLFHLGAVEGLQNLLPRCLQTCLQEINNLIKDLPLIVPFNFHLPSPPLFCPQMDSIGVDTAILEDEIEREFRSRSKMSYWIIQFCLLCSASGLDRVFVKFTIEEGVKSNLGTKDLINIYSSLEHGKENISIKDDDQWKGLKDVWLSFLRIICALHTRDAISTNVRSLVEAKMNLQKYKIIQEMSFQIMKRLSTLLVFNSTWKYEVFSLLVAFALDSSYTEETVHLVSKAVAHQEHIPSLLKDKFSKILEAWKDMKICCFYGSNQNNQENLFDLYQENLKLEQEKVKTTNQEDSFLFPLSKEHIDLICLLFSTSFLKCQFDYHDLEKPFPYLQQFSNRIKTVELEGLKTVEVLSAFIKIQNSKLFEDLKTVEDTLPPNFLETNGKQRKGLFRGNKTTCLQSSSENTARIFYNNINTSQVMLKKRTKSFSHKRKTLQKSELKRSKSLNYIKQEKEIQKKVLSLKCESSDISENKLFDKLVSDIYFSFQHLGSDLSSISPLFLNFILWILRSDRIFNKNLTFHNKISYSCLDIFSFSDLKQAIILHCSAIQSFNKKAVCKINEEKSRTKRKRVKILTKESARNPQQKVISNNSRTDKKLLDMKNIETEEKTRNNVEPSSAVINEQAESVLNISQIFGESDHIDNLPEKSIRDCINQHDDNGSGNRNDLDTNQWQPFIVKQKPLIHTTVSVNGITHAAKNKDYRAYPNGMYNPNTEYQQNATVKNVNIGNGFSLTSDETEYSSSQRYGATSDVLDNTLDDISLSKVLSDSNMAQNSSSYCKMSNEQYALGKQNIFNPTGTFERNYIDQTTLTKEKQSTGNMNMKILNCQKLRPETIRNELLLLRPHNLNLPQFANRHSKASSNEAEWTLRQIPVELLNKKIYARPEIKVPSTLLRIPVESVSQPPESFIKEIRLPTEILKKAPPTTGVNSFRLLKIPDEFKSTSVNRTKKREMLNTANVEHTLHDSRLVKVTKSSISDKFTQTHCENTCQVTLHKNIPVSKTKSDKIISRSKSDISLHKVKKVVDKGSPTLKTKVKSFKCKNVQTNSFKFYTKVTDNSTQTNALEEFLTPKISKEALNENLQVPTVIVKEPIREAKGVQVKFFEENNAKLADNHTQTTNVEALSIDQIPTEVRNNDSTITKLKERGENKSIQTNLDIHLELQEKFTQTRPEKISSKIAIEARIKNSKTRRSENREMSTAAYSPISVSSTDKCMENENSKDSNEKSYNNIHSVHQTFDKFDTDININEESRREDNDIYNQEFLSGSSEKDDVETSQKDDVESSQKDDIETYKNDGNSIAVNDASTTFNKNIYKENDITSKNICEISEIESLDNGYEKEDEILIGNNVSSTLPRTRPETVQDLINLFMSGRIQIDEVCNLASRFPELLKMIDNNDTNVSESPSKTLSHVVEDISKAKREISQTKCVLEKVNLIANKCIQDDLKIRKYFNRFLERNKSPTKVKLPARPCPTEVIEFLGQISPKALTQNNISQIMSFLDMETRKNRNISSGNKLISPVSCSLTITQNEMLNSEVVDHSHSRDRSGANYYILNEPASPHTENIYQQSELNLNLSNFGLGGYSPAAPFTPSESATAKEQRKKEIRAYMQRKRRERRENVCKPNTCDNSDSLTGKEIMERNRIMKTRREILKEEHFKKRKEEFEIMMEDHFCEKESVEPILTSKTNLVSPSRSFISNKKSKVADDSASCYYEKNSDAEFIVQAKPKSQKRKMNPLFKRELKNLSDYFATPRTSHRRLLDIKREAPLAISHLRRNTAKSNITETFSRSLERISEIDSSNLSSTDSSWSLPDDIKRILNHNEV